MIAVILLAFMVGLLENRDLYAQDSSHLNSHILANDQLDNLNAELAQTTARLIADLKALQTYWETDRLTVEEQGKEKWEKSKLNLISLAQSLLNELKRHNSIPVSSANEDQQKKKDSNTQQDVSKIKATYYLNEEDYKKLTTVYIRRLQNGIKVRKSSLIAEAIQLLYKREYKQ